MKSSLLRILACPACAGALTLQTFRKEGMEILDGKLACRSCASAYPLIAGVPRMLAREYLGEVERMHPSFFKEHPEFSTGRSAQKKGLSPKERTQRSFGYQWTRFSQMHETFRHNFLNYLYPSTEHSFKGKVVLDAGCGFGRHLFYAATFGAKTAVGLDFSIAADVSWNNTRRLPHAHVVQGDIYHPPFRRETFDLVYSVGVLHHLPTPESGFRSLLPLVRRGGIAHVWLYSKARPISNTLMEAIRVLTRNLPFNVLYCLCYACAILDYTAIRAYTALASDRGTKPVAEAIAPARIKLYSRYPFQVCFADWFDRLSAPIRFYYDEKEVRAWFERAELSDIHTSPTGRYGWRGRGRT